MLRLTLSIALICGTCAATEPLPIDAVKQIAARLKEKAFPTAKLLDPGNVSQAYNRPTYMLAIADGGERAKRLAVKKRETPDETFRRFFDSVTSLNIENRLYVTQFEDAEAAAVFVKERDGATGLDRSINVAAVRNDSLVLWGDKRLVEKAQKHW